MRQGWGGRPVDHKAAAGILIAALGVLAAHLGYGAARRASWGAEDLPPLANTSREGPWGDRFQIGEPRFDSATATAGRDPSRVCSAEREDVGGSGGKDRFRARR
jgi:hypothetical protein